MLPKKNSTNTTNFQAPDTGNILSILEKLFPDPSRNTLRQWLKFGKVFVDGVPISSAQKEIKKGQKIEILKNKKNIKHGISILYEDAHITVVYKPKGLLSVSTDHNNHREQNLFKILKTYYQPQSIFVVHRLDRDTSGIMVFARNKAALEALKNTFFHHNITRRYLAIVEGHLSKKKGTWKSYLEDTKSFKVRSNSGPGKGKLAITHYQELHKTPSLSLLQLELETGKKNQIRVHCSDAGTPIAGDIKYGAQTNPAKRLCLHAYQLSIPHPKTKKIMHFKSPIPEEIKRLIPYSFDTL